MPTIIGFDIETGPLEKLPPFDRSTVKLGVLKDKAKIEAKYVAAEQAYIERAALSPLTGRVLAIGIGDLETDPLILGGEESSLLESFWGAVDHTAHMVGFNIRGFDLPFLVRRSMLLGVDVPPGMIDARGYWHHCFVDLLDRWRCGDRQLWVKLDALAAAFGVAGKLEGVTGADFADLWHGTKKDREKAVAYLKQDVQILLELAPRMGV